MNDTDRIAEALEGSRWSLAVISGMLSLLVGVTCAK